MYSVYSSVQRWSRSWETVTCCHRSTCDHSGAGGQAAQEQDMSVCTQEVDSSIITENQNEAEAAHLLPPSHIPSQPPSFFHNNHLQPGLFLSLSFINTRLSSSVSTLPCNFTCTLLYLNWLGPMSRFNILWSLRWSINCNGTKWWEHMYQTAFPKMWGYNNINEAQRYLT